MYLGVGEGPVGNNWVVTTNYMKIILDSINKALTMLMGILKLV